MKILTKIFLIITIIAISVITILFIFFSIVEYRPPFELKLNNISQENIFRILEDNTDISILSWNINHALYSNSKNQSNESTIKHQLENIINHIQKIDADINIIQNVDYKSSRSYSINQVDFVSKSLIDYGVWYAENENIFYKPFPINNPVGTIKSGILTMSKYMVLDANRYSLPKNNTFFNGLFNMKECMVVLKIPIDKNEKYLYLINFQLTDYYPKGESRNLQLSFLRTKLLELYKEENYVIAGGEWNSKLSKNHPNNKNKYIPIPDNFVPEGWKLIIDEDKSSSISNTHINEIIIKHGYIVSPNIEFVNIKFLKECLNYSEHVCAILKVNLNNKEDKSDIKKNE